MRVPSVEKTADQTGAVWPSRVARGLPLASQSLAVLSSLAVRMRVPSVEKTADQTVAVWPSRVARGVAVGVPESGGVVIAGGEDAGAVGGEDSGPDRCRVAVEGGEGVAVGVPESGGGVIAGGEDAGAVGGEDSGP